jgi:hypothetical protein
MPTDLGCCLCELRASDLTLLRFENSISSNECNESEETLLSVHEVILQSWYVC